MFNAEWKECNAECLVLSVRSLMSGVRCWMFMLSFVIADKVLFYSFTLHPRSHNISTHTRSKIAYKAIGAKAAIWVEWFRIESSSVEV